MKNSNWKKYATSAAMVALVGTGAVGASQLNFEDLGVRVGVIEAAPVATPVNVVAFDQFAIVGSQFDPLANVSAFGVANGEVTDLSDSIKVVENTVNINEPGRYSVTYEATNADGQTDTETVHVVVDVNPSEALENYELSLVDLELALEASDINDEALQNQIDDLREQAESVRNQYDSIASIVENTESNIGLLEERLLPLQNGLDELYAGTVTLYADVSSLEESITVHKALADAELTRLEAQLENEKTAHENEVSVLEDRMEEAGDGEQVGALQKRVNESIARYESLAQRITDRIAEVTTELTNLDYEKGTSEGRDEVLASLIESNKSEIDGLETQIKAVKEERNAVLANLEDQMNGKLSDAELDEAKANVESAETYFTEREKGLKNRVEALKAQTEQLSEDDAAFAERIQAARDQLSTLRDRERDLESRITEELSQKQEVEESLQPVVGEADDEVVDEVVDAIVDGDLVNDEDVVETPAESEPDTEGEEAAADETESPVVEEETTEPTPPSNDANNEQEAPESEEGEDEVTDETPAEPQDDTSALEPDASTDEEATEGQVPAVDNSDSTSNDPALEEDVLVGGEDLGDDHVVYDEIPTIEDILGEDENVTIGAVGSTEGDEVVELPEDDVPEYVETEYSAGAGDSVVDAQTLSVSEVNGLAEAAEEEANASEEGKVATAATEAESGGEEKSRSILPQTGAAYGALGLAGTSLLAAGAAWIAKRRRK